MTNAVRVLSRVHTDDITDLKSSDGLRECSRTALEIGVATIDSKMFARPVGGIRAFGRDSIDEFWSRWAWSQNARVGSGTSKFNSSLLSRLRAY